MRRRKQRLGLNRETLRVLSAPSLAAVAAAFKTDTVPVQSILVPCVPPPKFPDVGNFTSILNTLVSNSCGPFTCGSDFCDPK